MHHIEELEKYLTEEYFGGKSFVQIVRVGINFYNNTNPFFSDCYYPSDCNGKIITTLDCFVSNDRFSVLIPHIDPLLTDRERFVGHSRLTLSIIGAWNPEKKVFE